MLPRHWQRLSDITGYTFEVDHGNFILKKVLEAPLLKNKEDIEVIYIESILKYINLTMNKVKYEDNFSTVF